MQNKSTGTKRREKKDGRETGGAEGAQVNTAGQVDVDYVDLLHSSPHLLPLSYFLVFFLAACCSRWAFLHGPAHSREWVYNVETYTCD